MSSSLVFVYAIYPDLCAQQLHLYLGPKSFEAPPYFGHFLLESLAQVNKIPLHDLFFTLSE